jgi:hypothetical protein
VNADHGIPPLDCRVMLQVSGVERVRLGDKLRRAQTYFNVSFASPVSPAPGLEKLCNLPCPPMLV